MVGKRIEFPFEWWYYGLFGLTELPYMPFEVGCFNENFGQNFDHFQKLERILRVTVFFKNSISGRYDTIRNIIFSVLEALNFVQMLIITIPFIYRNFVCLADQKMKINRKIRLVKRLLIVISVYTNLGEENLNNSFQNELFKF